jgi:EAL domain-containing protein (putative c-di-GMP-specific phosphodiesterase class I)
MGVKYGQGYLFAHPTPFPALDGQSDLAALEHRQSA